MLALRPLLWRCWPDCTGCAGGLGSLSVLWRCWLVCYHRSAGGVSAGCNFCRPDLHCLVRFCRSAVCSGDIAGFGALFARSLLVHLVIAKATAQPRLAGTHSQKIAMVSCYAGAGGLWLALIRVVFSITAPASGASSLGVMPTLLPSLPVVSAATSLPVTPVAPASPATSSHLSTTSTSCDSIVSWMLQVMAGQPQAAAGSSERVLIRNGLPTVPKKLLQKIRNWEYVELTVGSP